MADLATMLYEDVVNGAIKKNAIKIAEKMFKRGISIEAIAEDTGLDVATIKQVLNENDKDVATIKQVLNENDKLVIKE